ncbi:hydroxylysine kinase [Plakobranchus ocellatus]|uniref:Hydroxylysine kinase n=1 Tax=Plakobranchus ocellatus TaxID=259542 RepID=A0AAV4A6Q3_9GAST|nr:hydroxylysine kinase [Plakobranchus ocellatus]
MSLARSSFKACEIPALVKDTFGLEVTVEAELDSYDDQNFLIHANFLSPNPSNIPIVWQHGYVFKILNSEDSKEPDYIDAQTKMIVHVAKAGYPTPAPVLSVNNRYMESVCSGTPQTAHLARLFEFMPGKTLDKVPLTNQLCYEIGWFAGKLNITLKTCFITENISSAMTRKWNLSELPSLRQDLHVIKSTKQRSLIEEVIDEFEKHILNQSYSFSKGLIHSDFNDGNILVEQGTGYQQANDPNIFGENKINNNEYHICGIIDFGDATNSLYIYDLAIAIAYAMINKHSFPPMEAARNVLSGYLKHMHLSEWELKHLRLVICARFVQSLVIGGTSLLKEPENMYIPLHMRRIWPVLMNVWNRTDSEILSEIMGKT